MKYSHEGHVERKGMSLFPKQISEQYVSNMLEDHSPAAPSVAQDTSTGRCALLLALLL